MVKDGFNLKEKVWGSVLIREFPLSSLWKNKFLRSKKVKNFLFNFNFISLRFQSLHFLGVLQFLVWNFLSLTRKSARCAFDLCMVLVGLMYFVSFMYYSLNLYVTWIIAFVEIIKIFGKIDDLHFRKSKSKCNSNWIFVIFSTF